MGFKLDDEKNWGEFVHEHAVDELADQVEANRVKNEEQDQRLDDHDQHLAKLDEDLATETRERKEADEAEKEAREAADEAEKTAREQADQAEKEAREQADEAEKEAREQADAEHLQRIVATEDKNTEQDGRLGQVESMNATQNQRLQSLEDKDSEQDGRLDGVESKNTEQDTNITSLSSHNAEQDKKIQANANKDAQQDIQLTNYSSRLLGLENKKDENTYPTNLEFIDADYDAGKTIRIKLTQNDESKSIVENLPQPALYYEDESGQLILTYLNTASSVTLPTKTDTEKLTKELAEQEHLREIDNISIKDVNSLYPTDEAQAHFHLSKYFGEYVTPVKTNDEAGFAEAIGGINNFLQYQRISEHEDGLVFVNTLSGEAIYEGTRHFDKTVHKVDKYADLIPNTDEAPTYMQVLATNTEKQILVLAPVGTVLYQVGYDSNVATPEISDALAPAFLFNLTYQGRGELPDINGTETADELATKLKDMAYGDLSGNGTVHIPLTFNPRNPARRITELDIPTAILSKLPKVNDSYEYRMYSIVQ